MSDPPGLGWAHRQGDVDLGPVATTACSPGSLVDRLMVAETVNRYAWAFDERRLDLLRDLFTPDVTFGYTIRGSDGDDRQGLDEVLSMLRASMDPAVQTRHLLGSHVVEALDADRAVVLVYALLVLAEPPLQPAASGYYRFTLQRVGERWLVDGVVNGLDVALAPPP